MTTDSKETDEQRMSREYVESHGSKCPNCKSEEIKCGKMQYTCETSDCPSEALAWSDCSCKECKTKWLEVYKLSFIESVEIPETIPIKTVK